MFHEYLISNKGEADLDVRIAVVPPLTNLSRTTDAIVLREHNKPVALEPIVLGELRPDEVWDLTYFPDDTFLIQRHAKGACLLEKYITNYKAENFDKAFSDTEKGDTIEAMLKWV